MSGDLISRDAVIDIIHRFFTEEVDKIPTKKTEDGEVLIMCKAQPLFAMNKAICKRIKALPSVTAEEQEPCEDSNANQYNSNALNALEGDAISRQAVLDLIEHYNSDGLGSVFYGYEEGVKFADAVNKLPPVNPQEPKTEKVIKMRNATPEEREAIDKYIKSISKPTVVDFWDLEQEPKTDTLDKIRAEIEELADADGYGDYQLGFSFGLMMAMEIIDRLTDFGVAVSIRQIDNAPTVNAIPIKALYELKSEVEKHISQPRGYIKEVYEMGKDNAYENVLELIDMKILEYGSDAE